MIFLFNIEKDTSKAPSHVLSLSSLTRYTILWMVQENLLKDWLISKNLLGFMKLKLEDSFGLSTIKLNLYHHTFHQLLHFHITKVCSQIFISLNQLWLLFHHWQDVCEMILIHKIGYFSLTGHIVEPLTLPHHITTAQVF